ncbi:MAG: sulfotransferase [Planctomycetota bacterium]
MTLPRFLIIGGMKCGSTTLFRDLLTHPRVFFPLDKEPEHLTRDDVLDPASETRAEYEALFARARPDQFCAEASTAYTKRPDFEGVAKRARALLGERLKVIYLVREPIKRLVSHHYHSYTEGRMPADIARSVREFPELIEYSRYAHQAEPWLDELGEQNVRILRFEDLVADRPGVVGGLQGWLGLEPMPGRIDAGRRFNSGDSKPVATGGWKRLANNDAYRRYVRPLLPLGMKDRIRGMLLPKAPPRPDPPGPELVAELRERLAPDLARLAELLGRGGEDLWPAEAPDGPPRRGEASSSDSIEPI